MINKEFVLLGAIGDLQLDPVQAQQHGIEGLVVIISSDPDINFSINELKSTFPMIILP